MDVETKVQLALAKPTEEVVSEADVRELFQTNAHPTHYCGFEISGKLHIGSLMVTAAKVKHLQAAGVTCKIFLADWHSVMNEKFGGNWDTIKKAAKWYEEAFKTACPGVEVVLGSDLYHANDEYWRSVVEISRRTTIPRVMRCTMIMGRNESDKLSVAQLMYPPMQAADIKFIGADIAHAGMDQRKIHMLAREAFPALGWRKPVAIHHHLLMGLGEPELVDGRRMDKNVGQGLSFEKAAVEAPAAVDGESRDAQVAAAAANKMSKSKPWTAVFIQDKPEEIKEKLKKAYCPAKVVENNPILDWSKNLLFVQPGYSMSITRPAKFGGDAVYASYAELEKDFVEGKLHPMDLKNAVGESVIELLRPVREALDRKPELAEVFNTAQVTR